MTDAEMLKEFQKTQALAQRALKAIEELAIELKKEKQNVPVRR